MMPSGSLQPLHATSIKHHNRGLTLVFGLDGQLSLIGGEIPTVPIGIPPVLTTGGTGVPSGPTSVSPIPKLDATSVSLTGTLSFTPTPTVASVTSSLAPSSFSSSSATTSSNTNIPSVPTASYPTPSPSAVSNSNDHGVGAPFYLAIVLASISFVGCIAAFVAWWIRSRARKRDFELEDPWHHRNTPSDTESPLADSTHGFEKGARTSPETQTQPYYLPASIVRRSSPDLITIPHTILNPGADTQRSGNTPAMATAGRYPSFCRVNDPHFHGSANQNVPSSQTNSVYSRPSTARLDTGLSVQESTRTLGMLRITNRVPGDVTSGDEGGMNIRRLQSSAGPSIAPNPVRRSTTSMGGNAVQSSCSGQSDPSVRVDGVPLDPPGPATIPWGRRTDTIAALRRTRRRTSEVKVQTYKNPRYGGYRYPMLDSGSSTMAPVPDTAHGEESIKNVPANPPLDPLGWTSNLKSSFWQAVDSMTGNRPTGPEPCAPNSVGGSRFTPAPQRVAPRRSPVSPTHISTCFSPTDNPTAPLQEAKTKYELIPPEKPSAIPEALQSSTHLHSGSSSTKQNESDRRLDSLSPRVSRLNRDLGTSTHRRHPESRKADTGSVCSTDSAIARKYGHGDPIPSSWSALGARRESQLDLDHMYAPLPLPIPSSSPGPLSITPSLLTLESGQDSSFAHTNTSTRTYMPIGTPSEVARSDTLRFGQLGNPNMASDAETRTMSTMSRSGTTQSGRSTIGHENGAGSTPMPSLSSATSSMLSRKKGVATRRKRPRLPPRAPSTASSVQSIESSLSIREVVVRKALLERRRRVKAAETLKGREGSLAMPSCDVGVGSIPE